MKILALDDEPLALEMLSQAILDAYPHAELHSFQKYKEALTFLSETPCDIAFLDIHLRGASGVEIAKQAKDRYPKLNIIFVTGYDSYTGDAMSLHASGYILKPVTKEKILREVSDLRYPLTLVPSGKVRIRCFGNFDVLSPDGTPIHFERSKAKEVLAYLVYRNGTSCTSRELSTVLFDDGVYDRKRQVYIQKILSSMLRTLKAHNADGVIHKTYNSIALVPDLVDCDYYRFLNYDVSAINSYSGEFMAQYSWAEFIVGYLEQLKDSPPSQ